MKTMTKTARAFLAALVAAFVSWLVLQSVLVIPVLSPAMTRLSERQDAIDRKEIPADDTGAYLFLVSLASLVIVYGGPLTLLCWLYRRLSQEDKPAAPPQPPQIPPLLPPMNKPPPLPPII